MKVQYFGDKHDFRKYALLRKLAGEGGFKIGVCWMLTPDDGRADGGMRSYLDEGRASEWRHYDEELYDLLAPVVSSSSLARQDLKGPTIEHLKLIEAEGLIKGAVYFNGCLSRHTKEEVVDRSRLYFGRVAELFSPANPNLIFFDPDNGFTERCSITNARAVKYLYLQEAKRFYDDGNSLVVYQHFPFINRDVFVPRMIRRLSDFLGGCTVKAFETPNVLFLVAIQLEHEADVQKVFDFVALRWPKKENLVWVSERPAT